MPGVLSVCNGKGGRDFVSLSVAEGGDGNGEGGLLSESVYVDWTAPSRVM